jgi:hypothetical protein
MHDQGPDTELTISENTPGVLEAEDRGISAQDRLLELEAMQKSFKALEPLESDGRRRAMDWLLQAFEMTHVQIPTDGFRHGAPTSPRSSSDTGQDAIMTPKEFLSAKKPQSAVERIACLAYYLDRYRNLNHFKLADLVELNREAAAHKFGNPSRDVSNADLRNGYIVSAGGVTKQITARGEAVVEALPDRDSVKAALQENEFRKKRGNSGSRRQSSTNEDPEP